MAFSVNIGRAWRAPTAFELFVDGVHEGTSRYEVGNSNIDTEQSFNTEASFKYISGIVISEFSVYNNQIDGYIFPNPSDRFDPESGFRIFEYEQDNARIYGAEYGLEAKLLSWLTASTGFSIVRGNNNRLNEPLPLIPADQVNFGLKFSAEQWLGLKKPSFSIDSHFYAKQDRVANFETQTSSYSLFDISLNGKIDIGKQNMDFTLQAKNMFNESYRSHLSRYKEYALNPGRNIQLKLTIPFNAIP
jgi:iron complex outermembrane receptor protein